LFFPYHIVEKSPWPLIGSISALCLTLSMILWINNKNNLTLSITFIILILTSFRWWKNVFSETIEQGNHSRQVTVGLQVGILLFIVSEVLFFTSFFWAFFHRRISPNVELGIRWPPQELIAFNPINVPLLNTLLLLSSGVSITWCHHALLKRNKFYRIVSLSTTILLGILFSMLQGFEYVEAPFSIADSVYGSTFFIATGFHGLHVIIGSTFLIVNLLRLKNMKRREEHLTGFECAAWYWHFVDVVWLFLYLNLYWWGS